MGKRAADGAAVLAAPEAEPEVGLLNGDLEGSSSDEEAQEAAPQPAANAGELINAAPSCVLALSCSAVYTLPSGCEQRMSHTLLPISLFVNEHVLWWRKC